MAVLVLTEGAGQVLLTKTCDLESEEKNKGVTLGWRLIM